MDHWEVKVRWTITPPAGHLDPALHTLKALIIQAPTLEAAEHYSTQIIQALEDQANANPPVQ